MNKQLTSFLFVLCVSLTAWAIEIPKAGAQYMPAEIEPITAPFDVSGIQKPVYANNTKLRILLPSLTAVRV